MDFHGLSRHKATRYLAGTVVAALALAGAARFFGLPPRTEVAGSAVAATNEPALGNQPEASNPGPASPPSIELTATQLASFKIGTVGTHVFPVQDEAIGSIDFNEDMETQVFTNYNGRIVSLFSTVGADVRKDQPLFTIDSPDLVQAESTLISAAGVLRLTTRALERARDLYAVKGIAQKDFDQAVSDQQGAEGNYRAAVDAVRIFGKTTAEIEQIALTRKVDSILIIPSPITGRVTARNAAPGLFVQAGNAPAPFTVADLSTMWMVASVEEADASAVKVGQAVRVSILAYPGHIYEGRITTVAAAVDPILHTFVVRSEILDPVHELRPGMFARFVITTASPVTAPAIPVNGVVREGDGTMTTWVTTDRHTFTQRIIKIGLLNDGYDQILEGLQPSEQVVTDGAVFLDNMLTASPTD